MRRTDKEITGINEKLAIIEQCKVCRLGLSKNNQPYVVPLNYGYAYENERLTLYFHSAKEGRKIDIMQGNPNACFEIDCDTQLITGEKACGYGYTFKSIIGFGTIAFLETPDEKTEGLNRLMKHQTGNDTEHRFTEKELRDVCVYKIIVKEFTGKQDQRI